VLKKILTVILAILAVLAVVAVVMVVLAQPADACPACLREGPRPLVIAHRGYSAVAPENTLPAFRLALATGADFVELDTHHSKDGVPMVLHDYTLDRTTDATNRWGGEKLGLSTKTVAELQTLDAGRWFDPKFAGTKLPTLAEALAVIQGGGGMTLIERKAGDPATLVKLLSERKLVNQLVVQSFDWKFLKEFHALQPGQVTGALGFPSRLADGTKPESEDKRLTAHWLEELAKTGARIVVWSKDVTRETVALAHQRGLKVWVYTIDDPKTANELLDLGVDGLITNNPGVLWRTLAHRGQK
jgi:glycerophosphoryl diester phosphodiesterase